MSAKTFELPSCLTKRIVGEAVISALASTANPFWQEILEYPKLHIVVLVQKRVVSSRKHSPGTILPHILFEHSHSGRPEGLQTARNQAFQHWSGCANSGTNAVAHLLFSDSSSRCGSVKEEGLVVACYGAPSHYAKMIAGFIAHSCIALSQDKLLKNRKKVSGDHAH